VALSIIAYLGLGLLAAGGASAVRPRLLRLRRRREAAILAAAGLVLATAGAWWPLGTRRSAEGTRLEAFVPEFQFGEFHETRVRAAPEEVHGAIRAVTAGEIRWFRSLTWIRSPRLPGRAGPETILHPAWNEPVVDVALRSGFVLLAEEPGEELVVGTVVCCEPVRLQRAEDFRALVGPGFARAALNFRVEDLGGGTCRLSTETRIVAAGAAARRRFGLYWSFIYPGSSLIRYGWLEAIRKRAEAAAARSRSTGVPG